MKFFTLIIITLALVAASCGQRKTENENAQDSPVLADTIKKSIPKEEHAMVGDAHITIKYHSPGVKGRVVWGGLVPFDQVWVTGAHMATSFEINKDFEVNGITVPAGKYALFTIPGKESWTFIINKNWEQHLADEYSAADDVLRLEVAPEENEHTERLSYTISGKDQEAELAIAWEKIKLTIPFRIK